MLPEAYQIERGLRLRTMLCCICHLPIRECLLPDAYLATTFAPNLSCSTASEVTTVTLVNRSAESWAAQGKQGGTVAPMGAPNRPVEPCIA